MHAYISIKRLIVFSIFNLQLTVLCSSAMANEGRAEVVITIQPEKTPWLLHPLAGTESCCIFRVPYCLAQLHPKAYHPHILSMGPYHHSNPHLHIMQQHKHRYLHEILSRTQSHGPRLEDYTNALMSREQEIRACYSEDIALSGAELIGIMVLDGLFVIELFCREFRLVRVPPSHGDDPIFNLAWMKPNLIMDLLRLENQIPFFVLLILFEKFKASAIDDDDTNISDWSVSMLALQFINYAVRRPEDVLNYPNYKAKHLLDLVRLSFTPQTSTPPPPQVKSLNRTPTLISAVPYGGSTTIKDIRSKVWRLLATKAKKDVPSTPSGNDDSVQLIKSARKLYKCGIKFTTVAAATSFLDVKFRNGVLKIPNILIDDLLADLFLNFVAFEQYHYWHCASRHITSYTAFMSCLIRTTEDATFLRDRDIIDNYLGTDEEVCNFFRNLGKDVAIYTGEGHLCELFKDVNKYQRNVWHVTWGEFKFKYFDTPWSFASALAAVVVLLLTIVQTFFTVFEYSSKSS